MLPCCEKGVVSTILFSKKSMYPELPKEISFSTEPIGFITEAIPLLDDLIKYLPLSIALKTL